jgi:4-hydroxythreonine-4-phosphate dehydrogenase
MKEEENIVLGISIGDLNGIGGEIILKTFEDERILDFCTPVIFASANAMHFLSSHFNSQINFQNINAMNQMIQGKVNVFTAWNESVKIEFGKEDPNIGSYAIKSLEAATKALKNGEVDVLVTAPINKSNIQADNFKFPGHTDYLAQELEGESLMFMIADTLRVGLLTDHVPVKEVSNHITPKLIEQKINTVYDSLKKDFKIQRPKIAVLGINPHTGDNGVIGREDDDVLRPTLQKIKASGKLVFGPYAADSFFGSNNFKNFDAIIASYHDQGLIPFKTLAFGQGVNFTAGLNKIRTSPDHGTAYEIAGKGIADENSFKEAVFSALQIFKNRSDYDELMANPLKKASRNERR